MTKFKEIHDEVDTSTVDCEKLEVKNIIAQNDGAAGSLKDSAGTDIKCDAYIQVTIGGTTYYIPAYDTKA